MLKVVPSPNQMLDDLVRDLARLKGSKFVHGLISRSQGRQYRRREL